MQDLELAFIQLGASLSHFVSPIKMQGGRAATTLQMGERRVSEIIYI